MATIQQLPSGNWRVLFYIENLDGTRTRKSLTAPTRWEAERLAAEYSGSVEHLTVAKALDGYLALKKNVLSPSTLYGDPPQPSAKHHGCRYSQAEQCHAAKSNQ